MSEANFNQSWIDLFRKGKWKDCSHSIQEKLKTHVSLSAKENNEEYVTILCLENNMFICDQLSWDWDLKNDDRKAHHWAQSFLKISEMHRFLRCQYLSAPMPVDVVLCVTCNLMWWALMKIDPLNQHSCIKETLNAAIFSLNTVGKCVGASLIVGQPRGCIGEEFIQVVENLIPCFNRLTCSQWQLVQEIMILGLFNILASENHELEKTDIGLELTLHHIIETLPEMKVHFSYGHSDEAPSKYPHLVKFGWHEVVEVLSPRSTVYLSDVVLTFAAVVCLRQKTKSSKKSSIKALSYLNKIDKTNLTYLFLFHYLCALANFNIGNFEDCLYHLKCTPVSSSNFFMQGRSKTLRGQTLLSQNKPAAALEVLQGVEYRQKEAQIPLCAYLIGLAYQKLSKFKEQTIVLDLLLECLCAEPAVQPKLVTPLVGMEHRLLLFAHVQPEVSYKEALQSSAAAYLHIQPKEAAEKLLQFVHLIALEKGNCGTADISDSTAMWKVSELLHDAACALLKDHCVDDAIAICEEALRFHVGRFNFDAPQASDFPSLPEDVIALMLLAEAKDYLGSPDVSDTLNRCARLLQNLSDKVGKSGKGHEKTLSLSKALLARVFLNKAILNAKRNFKDDAVACFQRALTWNGGDPEVIIHFASFLLDSSQMEESLALWGMFNDCEQVYKQTDNITIDHLLGERMNVSKREEVLCRLQSLTSL